MAIVADRQPAGKPFYSRFVDPNLPAAGNSVNPFAPSGLEHFQILEGVRIFIAHRGISFSG